ncbi:hypothetical protein SIN8267_02171 [Sinobacterium norvegicum]|uniref:DUF3108 domain-containing protein n=1 Tax=Sinobacterium norvegicum TaxID=1641715 RepID=A0ABN8EI85_9GAMM|nr:DUF3108 domain-containing protein [Sinobacterium norvegicum]CAH0992056.1 hypothetical protein SIN8267_02171 [Sinobacterium norvegicum]
MRLIFTLAALILGANTVAEPNDALAEYRASYQTTVYGIEATAERSLTKLPPATNGDRRYQLNNHSKVPLASINETSIFSIDTNNQLHTETFSRKRGGLGSSKAFNQQWQWSTLTVTSRYKKQDYIIEIYPRSFDRLNYQLAIRLEADSIINGQQYDDNYTGSYYPVVDRKSLRDNIVIHYRGEERLTTPLGELDTLKFEQSKVTDPGHSTTVWLAKDWHNLIAQFVFCDEGNCDTIKLTAATIDGKNVTGAPSESPLNKQNPAE